MTSNGDLKVTHAGQGFPVQSHFVETQHLPTPLLAPQDSNHKHRALLDRPLARHNPAEHLIEILEIGLCQKAQVTGVDRQNRYTDRGGLAGRGKHRTIAA